MTPFIKTAFADMDGDGRKELLAGAKDGSLALYRSADGAHWQAVPGYFNGLKSGAFTAPAAGDLDGDGKIDLAVGTGGFSKASGRVLIFRNAGDARSPKWEPVDVPEMDIGDDASPAILDYNLDGRPDIVAGNSEGRVFFYKNMGGYRFIHEAAPPAVARSFGMYVALSGITLGADRAILAVGISDGKIVFYEFARSKGGVTARMLPASISTGNFACPSFADILEPGRPDLVLSDSDGAIRYMVQKGAVEAPSWKEDSALFKGVLSAGPASDPTVVNWKGRRFVIVGNIDGILRLFEYDPTAGEIPWRERKGYFYGAKAVGFARACLADWQGKPLLVVGQSDGRLRAFLNVGSEASPFWREERAFFRDISIREHSAPFLIDIVGDGHWDVVSGAGDGRLYVFRLMGTRKGVPSWERVSSPLDDIKVKGFSVPTLVRTESLVFLFVGQQDGRIRSFVSARGTAGPGPFAEISTPGFAGTRAHCAPSAILTGQGIDVVAGDYDGNLRSFQCLFDDPAPPPPRAATDRP